jgi:prephenate dehydrogenase
MMKSILFLALIGMTISTSCDDGSQCPDGSTCCALSSGGFGCCPYDGATCCADHTHCCPNGYACNVEQGTCIKQQGANDFLSYVGLMEKLEKSETKKENVSSIAKCIEDIPAIIADLKSVIDDIEAKNVDALISLLPKVLADAEKVYADCRSSKKLEFIGYKGIEACVADIPVFVQEVMTLVKDAEAKDMSAIIALLPQILAEGMKVYADCSSAHKQVQIFESPSFNGIEQCKEDFPVLVADLKTAVADIQAHDLEALKALLPKFLADAQKTYSDCTSVFRNDLIANYKGAAECIEDLPVFAQEVMDLVKDIQARDVEAIENLIPEILAEAMKLYNDCSSAFRK